MITEALAAVLLLGQLPALDHSAHGAVNDDDALGQQVPSVASICSRCLVTGQKP
jgi:hypothetical protein